MSEERHTPGPWRACRNGDCTCGSVWSIPGDFPVCTVQGEPVAVVHQHMADAPDLIYQSITPEMKAANGRLIAAAPDLLGALRAIVNSDMAMREEDEGRVSPELEAARAAIAKATQDQTS